MLVMKFGGTSVDGARKIQDVARLVQNSRGASKERGDSKETVVVLSAMAGVTDALVAAARAAAGGQTSRWRSAVAALASKHKRTAAALSVNGREGAQLFKFIDSRFAELTAILRSLDVLGELTARGLDQVAGTGERLSTRFLAFALQERGIESEAVDAGDGVIVTDDRFGDAQPDEAAIRRGVRTRLAPLLKRGVVPVVTGFLGATPSGETTTLGRGGSDYTAALIGAALEADEVWIWSDVDGILSADPKVVPEARVLDHLSYAAAAEMAACGADVLHPKTIRPLARGNVPLRLKNTFNPAHRGTLISSGHCEHAPAIISASGLALVTIAADAEYWSQEEIAAILKRLARAGVNVLFFVQSAWHHGVSLLIGGADREAAMTAAASDNLAVSVQPGVATISVFGPGVNLPAMAVLGETCAEVLAVLQAGTDSEIVVVVPENEMPSAVRLLHDRVARTAAPANLAAPADRAAPGVCIYEN
jgi:aspartate kinase